MIARRMGIASGLLALAACNQGTPVDMANPPHTRAGAWVETGTLHGQTRAPFTFCDPGRPIFPAKDASCSQWQAVRLGDGSLDFNAVCTDGAATIHLHRRIVGDLASGFTDDITSTMDAPNEPKNALTAHSVLRFQGPCQPGMKPITPAAG
ncbi:MAG TPA: hypothetical protein VN694_03250 [Caulobacteraceae bacterium]|nr:hypothetical protein [Caulobacteraceae bacterium]